MFYLKLVIACMIVVLVPFYLIMQIVNTAREDFNANCTNSGGHVYIGYGETTRLCLTADGRLIEVR